MTIVAIKLENGMRRCSLFLRVARVKYWRLDIKSNVDIGTIVYGRVKTAVRTV